MTASEFRLSARQVLKGKWTPSLTVTLLAGLLGASYAGLDWTFEYTERINEFRFPLFYELRRWPDLGTYLNIILNLVPILAVFYLFITFVLGPVMDIGIKKYYINCYDGVEQNPYTTLQSRNHILLKALGLSIIKGVFILLWGLLLIVPGIIAAYRYAMTDYLLAENPDLGIMEAINKSKEMMKGHKAGLFCLQLSFIGWAILSALTFGIGFLWYNPYYYAAETAFYLHLCEQDTQGINDENGGNLWPEQP
ncbi:MAG: DUF975 family protein [Clostridiales bacterium]